jgi:hypothetical protein
MNSRFVAGLAAGSDLVAGGRKVVPAGAMTLASRPPRCWAAGGRKGDDAGTSMMELGEEGPAGWLRVACRSTTCVGWVKYGDSVTVLSSSSLAKSSERSSRRREAKGEERSMFANGFQWIRVKKEDS